MTENAKPLPAKGAAGKEADRPEREDPAECFTEDEFICPACCCGLYIEVKE